MFIRMRRERQITHLSGELINCNQGEEVTVAGYVESVYDLDSKNVAILINDSLGDIVLSINKKSYMDYTDINNITTGSLLLAKGAYNNIEEGEIGFSILIEDLVLYRNEGK